VASGPLATAIAGATPSWPRRSATCSRSTPMEDLGADGGGAKQGRRTRSAPDLRSSAATASPGRGHAVCHGVSPYGGRIDFDGSVRWDRTMTVTTGSVGRTPTKDGNHTPAAGTPRSTQTRNKIRDCIVPRWNETKKKTVLRTLGWEETKKGDTVGGARLTIETGADFRSVSR